MKSFKVCISISNDTIKNAINAIINKNFTVTSNPENCDILLTDNYLQLKTNCINMLVVDSEQLSKYKDAKDLGGFNHYIIYNNINFLSERILKSLKRHLLILKNNSNDLLSEFTGANAIILNSSNEELIAPNIFRSFKITSSKQRSFFADELEKFLQSEEITKHIKTSINSQYPMEIQDELLMNAIWDANPKYSAQLRTVPIELSSEEEVSLEWAFNGKELAISVRDPFGRFNPNIMTKYIDFAFKRKPNTSLENKFVNAGLGLYMIVQKANLLSVFIRSGKLTEVGVILLLSERRNKYLTSKTIDIIKI